MDTAGWSGNHEPTTRVFRISAVGWVGWRQARKKLGACGTGLASQDEAVTVKLHQHIEEGIKKQRELHAKMQSGELAGREARQQGRQLMEEGRVSVVELLGEPAADRFFKVLGEEMQKEFEKQKNRPRE